MKPIIDQLIATTFWEWIGFLFGILQVLFAIKNKIINFLFGFISAIVYTYVFAIGGLYAEASLNIYYAMISIIGLVHWKNKIDSLTDTKIETASKTDWLIAVMITLSSFVISYSVLKNYTQSTVPMWDSVIAAFAWSGSWLLTKRKLETWLLLNISNAIAIPLLIQKGFLLTSILTGILFLFAIVGYWQWKKLMKNSHVKH